MVAQLDGRNEPFVATDGPAGADMGVRFSGHNSYLHRHEMPQPPISHGNGQMNPPRCGSARWFPLLGTLCLAGTLSAASFDLPITDWVLRPGGQVQLRYTDAEVTPTLQSGGHATITVTAPGTGNDLLTIVTNVAGTTPAGTYSLVIRGESNSGNDKTITLKVGDPPSLSVSPSTEQGIIGGQTITLAWTVADAQVVGAGHSPSLCGLRADVWMNYTDQGTSVPSGTGDHNWIDPNLVFTNNEPYASTESGTNGWNYFARWQGRVVPTGTAMRYRVRCDDGARVYVRNVTTSPLELTPGGSWGNHGPLDYTTVAASSAPAGSPQPFRVDYYNHEQGQYLRLSWSEDGSSYADVPASAFLLPSGTSYPVTSRDGYSVKVLPGAQPTAGTIEITAPATIPPGSVVRQFTFRSVDAEGLVSAAAVATVRYNYPPTMTLGLASGGPYAVTPPAGLRCSPGLGSLTVYYQVDDDLSAKSALVIPAPTGLPVGCTVAISTPDSNGRGDIQVSLSDTYTGTTDIPIQFTVSEPGAGGQTSTPLILQVTPNQRPKATVSGNQQALPFEFTRTTDEDVPITFTVDLWDDTTWSQPLVPNPATVTVAGGSVAVTSQVQSFNATSQTQQMLVTMTPSADLFTSSPAVARIVIGIRDRDGLTSSLTFNLTITATNDACQLSVAAAPALVVPADASFTPVLPAVTLIDDPAHPDLRVGIPGGRVLSQMECELRLVGGGQKIAGETLVLRGDASFQVRGDKVFNAAGTIQRASWSLSGGTLSIVPAVDATASECAGLFALVSYGWLLGTPPLDLPQREVRIRVAEPPYSGAGPSQLSGWWSRAFTVAGANRPPVVAVSVPKVAPLGRQAVTIELSDERPDLVDLVMDPSPRNGRIEDAAGNEIRAFRGDRDDLFYRNLDPDADSDGFTLVARDSYGLTGSARADFQIVYVSDSFCVLGDPILDLVLDDTTLRAERIFTATDVIRSSSLAAYPTAVGSAAPWVMATDSLSGNRLRCRISAAASAVTGPWHHVSLVVTTDPLEVGGPAVSYTIPLTLRAVPPMQPTNRN